MQKRNSSTGGIWRRKSGFWARTIPPLLLLPAIWPGFTTAKAVTRKLNSCPGAFSIRTRVCSAKRIPGHFYRLPNSQAFSSSQGRYAEAEPLWKGALEVSERRSGKEHLDTLTIVNNLALLYQRQGRYAEAEPLHKRALEASNALRVPKTRARSLLSTISPHFTWPRAVMRKPVLSISAR